jgi:hypothetical protein
MGPMLDGPPPGLSNFVGMPNHFLNIGRHEIDRGQVAEALVFYDEVTLIGDPTRFLNLINNIGPAQFQRLLESKRLKLAMTQSRRVTHHGPPGARVFGIDGNLLPTPTDNLEHLADLFHDLLEDKHGKDADRLIDYLGAGISDSLVDDTTERAAENYASLIDLAKSRPSVIADLLKSYLSTLYPEDDFGSLRLEYEGELLETPQFRVVHELPLFENEGDFFADAFFDLFMVLDEFAIAMSKDGDFSIDPAMGAALRKLTLSPLRIVPQKEIDMFNEFVLKGRSVGTSIMMDHTFDELLSLLAKKGRFSAWLRGQTLEKGLVQAWIDHISNESWVDKLPAKSFRFVVATGLGIAADALLVAHGLPPGVGTGGSVGVAAFDSLVIDKFRQGWKPNQFVSKLAEFTAPEGRKT